MEQTTSATELMPVVVEPNGSGGADVWLNRNITTETDEDGNTIWHAEQVHYTTDGVPTADAILADFDEVWREHVGTETMSNDELADALAELSEISSENATMLADFGDAMAELSAIVSDLVGGE